MTATLSFIRINAAGLLMGMLASAHLWWLPRKFPLIPLFSHLPLHGSNNWLLAILGLLLLVTLIQPHRLVCLAMSGILVVVVDMDQIRLQPWVYFYFLLFVTYVISPAFCRIGWRLILSSMYFWAGFHKITGAYLVTGANLAHIAFPYLPLSLVVVGSAFIPALELFIGVGLWIPRYFRIARLIAYLMHVFILAVLINAHQNSVVWPWNLAIPGLLYFLPSPGSQETDFFQTAKWPRFGLAVMFFCLPVLSYQNWVIRRWPGISTVKTVSTLSAGSMVRRRI